MPIIANTTSGNTFSAVRAQLNSVTKRVNQFAVNESTLYANTITANTSFVLKGSLQANSSTGTAGHYLRTSGTGVYWSPVAASGATWAALTSTNTAIRALDAQKLSVANASATYAAKSSPTTSGLLAHTGRATISTNLSVSGNTTFGAAIIANNSTGTAGQYLRTSGTGVYWSPVAAGSSGASWAALLATNTAIRALDSQKISVANAASTYLAKSGGTMTGKLTITGNRLKVGESSDTVSYIEMMDDESTNGLKYIHCNSNVIGFLGGNAGWLQYVNSSGQINTAAYGWLHDYFFSTTSNCSPIYNSGAGNGDQGSSGFFYGTYDGSNCRTGNCNNFPGNCQTVAANCGNTTRYFTVLEDGGSNINIKAYQYNFNCNCNCNCC